jgi:deazaflavin-dependent oxidoreductase (nitroreductase family)
MTAGRLPFAFGNVRTALMPPPYRIILGTNPVDFISAIQPPRETKSLLSRQVYPSGPRLASKPELVAQTRACLYICAMDLKDGASIVADLTTIGRKSGLPRTVELRFIYHQGSFYASSSRVKGKHWCENLLENPAVVITVKGQKVVGLARQVNDDKLRREILAARNSLSDLDRIVFEIKPRD